MYIIEMLTGIIRGFGRLKLGLSENEVARVRRVLGSEELLPQAHELVVGNFLLSL